MAGNASLSVRFAFYSSSCAIVVPLQLFLNGHQRPPAALRASRALSGVLPDLRSSSRCVRDVQLKDAADSRENCYSFLLMQPLRDGKGTVVPMFAAAYGENCHTETGAHAFYALLCVLHCTFFLSVGTDRRGVVVRLTTDNQNQSTDMN